MRLFGNFLDGFSSFGRGPGEIRTARGPAPAGVAPGQREGDRPSERGEPMGVALVPSLDDVEERSLQSLGDWAALAGPDHAVIDLPNRVIERELVLEA